MSKLVFRDGLLKELRHRRHRLTAFLGQGGDRAQFVHISTGVFRLPVIGALNARTNFGRLAGNSEGLGETTITQELGA
jgi:hypothetical protein